MGDTTLDFATCFHNLKGELLGERKKNFFKLLRDPTFKSNEQQLNVVLQNLNTRNYLEEVFKIDTLIYFKRTEELLKILRNSSNEIFIKKIIKQHWFVEEAFKNMSAEEFVNDFLPYMAYSIKMKLLKNISLVWEESKMDCLFDNLLKCYGLTVAKTILHRCSSNKILVSLEDHEVRLNTNQVKYIFDKDINLFLKYLQHHNKMSNAKYSENKVINYVALKDPKLLLKLEDSNIITFRDIGRRKSKKIFIHAKIQIAEDLERYTKLLNKAVVVRKLGNEFPNAYQKIFPKKIDEINAYNICSRLLQLYSRNKRWQLFIDTLTTRFSNMNIRDIFLKFHDISKFNPDRSSFQNWAFAHYTSTNSERFLKYYDLTKSIDMIKDKINVTSDMYKRESLVTLLIESCAENNDLVALEDVLKYICVRHRNEESFFRHRILSTLKNYFKIDEFNETHWKYINEQIELLRIQKDFVNYDSVIFVQYYLQFLFKNAKPFTDVLLQFINDIVDYGHSFVLDLKNPETESRILKKLIEIVPSVIKKDKECHKYYTQLITYIFDFNSQNVKFTININTFPYLIDYIETIFQNSKFTSSEYEIVEHILLYNINFPSIAIPISEPLVVKMITTLSLGDKGVPYQVYRAMLLKKNRSHLETEVLKFYFEQIVRISKDTTIVNWFLINEPTTVLPYFNEILQNNLEKRLFDDKSLKYLKYYSHIGLDKQFCEFYINRLKEIASTADDKTIKIINSLRLLLPTDSFVTLINQYFLPKKIKLDLEDEEMSSFYKIQREILQKFHRVNEPSKILSVIMQFSQGDYLKLALPPLYSIFYRSPEQQLKVHLNTLLSRGLSVKKHALFLSCEVMSYDLVFQMLKDVKLSTTSGQKHVFSSILKYFLKNPSQELFDLVIDNVGSINENDSETLDYLQSVHIPHKYKPLYIEKCWQYYESLKTHEIVYKHYLNNFLKSTIKSTEVLKCLSSEFVNKIINVYFKTSDDELDCDMFVLFILKYRTSERNSNFEYVFQILTNFPTKRLIKFFTVFYDDAIENVDRDFVQIFTQYWNKTFSTIDTFKENMFLKLLCFRQSSTSMEMYAQFIVNYMEQLIEEFGFHIFNIFKSALKLIVEKEKEENYKYLLCLNILKFKCNTDTSILVLEILQQSYYEHSEETSRIHREIMDILKNAENMAVRIYYKYYTISDGNDRD